VILTSSDAAVDPAELERRTGWAIKPEGACKGAVCVPLPKDEPLTAAVLRDRLGMPLVGDESLGVWALGPSSATGRALDTAEVPDLVLRDLDGKAFALSSLRGRKVVVAAWASW
jgi:hypothetical protein